MSNQDFPPNNPPQPTPGFQPQPGFQENSAFQGQSTYQAQPPHVYQQHYGMAAPQAPGMKRVNKTLYILMSFFFSTFGVHRFLRGQVGIGVLMLLVSWMTLGIWQLIDFIIGLTKIGDYPGDDFVFTEHGNWA